MLLHWQDWLIIFLVPAIAFALGYGRRQAPTNYVDYFLARRNLGSGRFLAAFFGANLVFTAIFLVLSYEAAHRGWWVISIPISFLLGIILLAYLYPKLNFYFDQGQTLHQALGSAFEENSPTRTSIRKWAAVWTIIAFLGLVAIEFYGGILLLKWAGVPLLSNIIISILLATVCTGFTMAGGLRGVARADIWLDTVSIVGIALFFVALVRGGALTIVTDTTVSNHIISSSQPSLAENIIFCVVAFVLFVPMPICALDTWQRGVAWKERTQVTGFLLGGALGIVLVSIIAILVGLYARSLGWTIMDPYPLKAVLEQLHLQVIIVGLVIAGFVAAILSTADELLNCCAYAWMADFRQLPSQSDAATASRYLRSAKFYTAIFGYLAALLAILFALAEQFSDIRISGIFDVVASTQVVFFVPVLIALFRHQEARRYRIVAKFSMGLAFLTALLSALAGAFLVRGENGQALVDEGPLFAIIVSLVVMGIGWIVDKLRRPSRHEKS